MRLKFICLLSFLILAHYSEAQDKNLKRFFKNGMYFMDVGNYEKALDNFFYLYDSDSERPAYNYYVGRCYFEMPREKQKAKPYLLKASQSVELQFRDYDIDETNAPPEVYFMLGELYQFDEVLDSAKYFYEKYEVIVKSKEDKDLARHRLKSLETAIKLQENFLPFSASNLGPIINSEYSDYNPVISADEQTLAFTRFVDGLDEVYISRKTGGQWGEPENITKQLSTGGTAFTAHISADGNKLYLIGISDMGSDIFYATYDGNKWSKMKYFDSKINSPYFETSFFMNADETELYFSSDSPEGIGGIDIYYSKKNAKGRWENPTNLGSRINTIYDEETPYLSKDGKLLFFSSNGHETMGGYDVFFTEKMGEEVWSKPINIGYPLNTPANDYSFIALDDGNRAYIVKDLPGGYGFVDIYNVEVSKELLFADKLLEDISKYAGFNTQLADQEAPVSETEPNVPVTEAAVVAAVVTQEEVIPEESVNPEDQESDVQETEELATVEEKIEAPVEAAVIPVVVAETKKEEETIEKQPEPEAVAETVAEPVVEPIIETKTEPLVEKQPDETKLADPTPVTQYVTNVEAGYTVQIFALKKPVPATQFAKAGNVKRSDGDDGFTRYTVGYFESYREAAREQSRLMRLGYANCFIREVRTIQNY